MNKKIGRIGFIDLMRAYAILMMVQGHLVHALLQPELRNPDNLIYNTWNFMRGITAPVFFFASGIIFTILLLNQEKFGVGIKNPRVSKGFKRTLILMGIGYLLQFDKYFLDFLQSGDFTDIYPLFKSHVLHVIGIAISLILILYLILTKLNINHWFFYFAVGNAIFLFHPDNLLINWFEILPLPIANFLSKANGSMFTVIPWIGFSLFGASFGMLYQRNPKLINSYLSFIIVLITGVLTHFYSGAFLILIYEITGWENLDYLARNNFLHFRLGQVLIITGILGLISKVITLPKIITKIGSETLGIYILHSVLIYGAFTTFGYVQMFGKTLNGWQCLILVVFTEILMIIFAYYARNIREKFVELKTKFFKSKSV